MEEEKKDIFSMIQTLQREKQIDKHIYVSPMSLIERNFYWEALDIDGNPLLVKIEEEEIPLVISLPIPKYWITNIYNKLIVTAFNSFFAGDVSKNEIVTITGNGMGIKLLEYLYYILYNQEDVKEIVEQSEQKNSIELLLNKLNEDKVHKWVIDNLHVKGLTYSDALYNLLPLFIDLYLYINNLIQVLPADASIIEKASAIKRHL